MNKPTASKQKQLTQMKMNLHGIPAGVGSLSRRSGSWWCVYKDSEGRRMQRNAHTKSVVEARRVLCQLALPYVEARLDFMRRIADEGQTDLQAERGRGRTDRSGDQKSAAMGGGNTTKGGK